MEVLKKQIIKKISLNNKQASKIKKFFIIYTKKFYNKIKGTYLLIRPNSY